MAINQNHLFEDLDGVKCAVVEKQVSKERSAFLKQLLEFNGYKVVIVPSPPPKATPVAKPADDTAAAPSPPDQPESYTLGVTDVTFNAVNALFGRLLRTADGHVVTVDFWQQKSSSSRDDIPYFEKKQ